MEAMPATKTESTSMLIHAVRRRRSWVVAAVIVLGAATWYLFRPELLFVNRTVNEAFPVATANADSPNTTGQVRASGTFHGVAHATKGTAAIHELADGSRVLRLTGFETSNGPDVRVFLGKADNATDNETVKSGGYVDLGPLKGNIGDQNYRIPADVDVQDYKSVTVWCNRFGVNFGTAPLRVQ